MTRRILALITLGFVAPLTFAAPDPVPTARMERIVQEYVNNGEFMGAVLVARGDEVIYSKAFGSANLEWNIPNSITTKYRIGSITKQFTAAAILLLEERGKLAVDDPVKKFYPDAPATWDRITLTHLLTHTSGIPNFTSFPDFDKFTRIPKTPEELVRNFRDKPLDFQPGTGMRYSNSGYELLGLVIEKASGRTYAQFLEENLFEPFGLKDTGYDTNAAVLPQRAAGYVPGPKGRQNAGYEDMSVPFAAGALYSTVGDLHRWNQALYGGKVLKPESLIKMQTPVKNDYAFGLGTGRRGGQKVFGHSGGIGGFNTKLAYFPADGMTIVALGNINGPAADLIVDKIGSVTHGEAVVLPSERVEVPMKAALLEEYVGTYEIWPGRDLTISIIDGRLTITPGSQKPDLLFAEKKDRFFSKLVDAQIDFVRDKRGKVVSLKVDRAGSRNEAKRKPN